LEISGTVQKQRTLRFFTDPLLEKVCQRLFANPVKHGDHLTRIRVSHTITPDMATIFLEDNGIGIPKEKKEQIFFTQRESPCLDAESHLCPGDS
jgi:signal transduction histidine kinase